MSERSTSGLRPAPLYIYIYIYLLLLLLCMYVCMYVCRPMYVRPKKSNK